MIDTKPIEALLNAQCSKCAADTAKAIDTYIEQLEKLQAVNDQWKKALADSMTERDEIIKSQDAELRHMKEQQARPAVSADMTQLLDLLEPDISMKERIILNDERLIQIVTVFRKVRPLHKAVNT